MKQSIENPAQFRILDNGFISPCPYAENCAAYKLSDGVRADGSTYTRGCNGYCFFCGTPRL